MQAVEQDVCYSQYANFELKIKLAGEKLQNYLDNKDTDLADVYKKTFLDECANAACDDATWAIFGAITGDVGMFSCDILSILYSGNVNADYYQGW